MKCIGGSWHRLRVFSEPGVGPPGAFTPPKFTHQIWRNALIVFGSRPNFIDWNRSNLHSTDKKFPIIFFFFFLILITKERNLCHALIKVSMYKRCTPFYLYALSTLQNIISNFHFSFHYQTLFCYVKWSLN